MIVSLFQFHWYSFYIRRHYWLAVSYQQRLFVLYEYPYAFVALILSTYRRIIPVGIGTIKRARIPIVLAVPIGVNQKGAVQTKTK